MSYGRFLDKLLRNNMDVHLAKLIVAWYDSELFHVQ